MKYLKIYNHTIKNLDGHWEHIFYFCYLETSFIKKSAIMKIRIKLKEDQDYLKMKRLSGLVIAALRQGHNFGQEIMNKSYEIKNLSL